MIGARLFLDCLCLLGEGPVWWQRRIWWVDIEQRQLHACTPDTTYNPASWDFPERIGFAVPATDGAWVVGLESGFFRFDPSNGDLSLLYAPERDRKRNRCNDGKSDPNGCLWAGTLQMDGKRNEAALYRLSRGGSRRVLDGISISNGLAWDPARGRMYYIDTPTRGVMCFPYDFERSEIAGPHDTISLDGESGAPDGMTIDGDGNLWIALWGGGAVLCMDPATGKVVERIAVPAPNVTSCAFGGPDFRDLYITTARIGLKEDALHRFPHAGGLFVARPGPSGLPPVPADV